MMAPDSYMTRNVIAPHLEMILLGDLQVSNHDVLEAVIGAGGGLRVAGEVVDGCISVLARDTAAHDTLAA